MHALNGKASAPITCTCVAPVCRCGMVWCVCVAHVCCVSDVCMGVVYMLCMCVVVCMTVSVCCMHGTCCTFDFGGVCVEGLGWGSYVFKMHVIVFTECTCARYDNFSDQPMIHSPEVSLSHIIYIFFQETSIFFQV